MKITANRRDDILRRKAEWEAEFDKQKEAHELEYRNFEKANDEVIAPVQQYFESLFSQYPALDADIQVRPGRYGEDSLAVDIRVNEYSNKALSWGYKAFLNDGELIRETSSWSGMNAVTEEQIRELEESVAVLKTLVSIDWYKLLDRRLPKYQDYITTPSPDLRSKPNFDRELIEAELEDLVGTRKMVKVHPFEGSDYRGYVYVAIVKDSGSQYTIKEIPAYSIEHRDGSTRFDEVGAHRVKKSKINPVQPLEIIEV